MLEELSKYAYFRYFQEISAVPRGSGNNQEISDYLVDFAKKHHLWYYQDQALNVVIRKEAAQGYEDVPGIILQGHMDMVCEKDSLCLHDFTKDGLSLVVDGDFLYAEGTTLGGDDGIALAYGLAVLADDTKKYPMIELVVTTDEETGMYGAQALDTSVLQGRQMINLDTEEEGSLLVGCAGGLSGKIVLPVEFEAKTGTQITISLTGLQGGHSGCEIDKHRTNATLLLGRLLMELHQTACISSIEGGLKDNAIPREAKGVLLVDEVYQSRVCDKIDTLMKGYQAELRGFEPMLAYEYICKKNVSGRVLLSECQKKVLFLLNNAPNGVQTMNSEMKGMVESSLNMGIFSLHKRLEACYSIRSSRLGYKEYVSQKLKGFAEILGGSYEEGEKYPAWTYRADSPLRERMLDVYRRQYGTEPAVEAIHAGLECGILCEKCPEMDIVAIGPDIFDIHTPKERLSISSTIRVFEYLEAVLEELKERK